MKILYLYRQLLPIMWIALLLLLLNVTSIQSFVVSRDFRQRCSLISSSQICGERQRIPFIYEVSRTRIYSSTEQQQTDKVLRVSDIRSELDSLDIDYSDCFDKESLLVRLHDAREGKVFPKNSKQQQQPAHESSTTTSNFDTTVNVQTDNPRKNEEIDTLLMDEIRSMKVRELKEQLASRNIRWGGLLEKEDLVKALYRAKKDAAHFSVTGLITPGQVADLTSEQLQTELQSSSTTPLLLDVYATWCGPCKIMAEQLKQAAADEPWFANSVRLVKLDSDKHSTMAGSLKVGGLPTLVLFDTNGNEIDRIEGALMKNQLLEWVKSKI